ncbi:MAG: hypothetical protein ACLUYZ_02675 [Lachnospiraceae bacterium]
MARLLRVPEGDVLSLQVLRRSVDAREELRLVYTAAVELRQEKAVLRRVRDRRVTPLSRRRRYRSAGGAVFAGGAAGGGRRRAGWPVCGAGAGPMRPARPFMLEQGGTPPTRQRDVETFWRTGVLDPESNVQFGEGEPAPFPTGS